MNTLSIGVAVPKFKEVHEPIHWGSVMLALILLPSVEGKQTFSVPSLKLATEEPFHIVVLMPISPDSYTLWFLNVPPSLLIPRPRSVTSSFRR